jgi:outer membrane immunogenic protein
MEARAMRYKIASLAAAAIAFGGVQVASAADMAVKARPMVAPVATYTWTGCYIGVHLGGVWTRADVTDTVPYAAASVPGAVTSVNGAGVIGGGQVGCDYQFDSIVVGVEIDGGYMGAAHTDLLTGTASGTRVGTRDGAFMDFTARVGVAVWNQTLLYVKGGAAYRNRLADFSTVTGSFSSVSFTDSRWGWVVGGGVEYMFAPHWSVRGEYLHRDFRNADFTVFNAVGTPFPFLEKVTADSVTVGLNYRF